MGYNPHTASSMHDIWEFMSNIMQHGIPTDRDNSEKLYKLATWFKAASFDNWLDSKESFRQELRELKAQCTPYEIWGKEVGDIAEILLSDDSDRRKVEDLRDYTDNLPG
jgi:hypothetical protein